MTFLNIIFFITAAVVVTATGFAITRQNAVHAVCYLVISFMGTAVLFYLLGAPLLAALEVIIYAGGIMVLFLFVIMMIRDQRTAVQPPDQIRTWLPALILSGLCGLMACFLVYADFGIQTGSPAGIGAPRDFGRILFNDFWLPVEIASLLLLASLVGALYLGRKNDKRIEDIP